MTVKMSSAVLCTSGMTGGDGMTTTVTNLSVSSVKDIEEETRRKQEITLTHQLRSEDAQTFYQSAHPCVGLSGLPDLAQGATVDNLLKVSTL